MLPSLNALRAAEAVGRWGSLSRAAANLGVSPSAVSHQLKTLEAHIGRPLFDRTDQGLVPTEAGRQLLPALTQAFQGLTDAVEAVMRPARGVLTVSCGLAFAARFLVPRLTGWAARHPDIEIRLVTTNRLVDFDRDDIDVAVRFGTGDWPGLRAECLAPQPFQPVCSPAVAKALRQPRARAKVALIEDALSLVGWAQWAAATGALDITGRPLHRLPDAALAYEAAMAGQGLWLGWPVLYADALADGRLVAPFDAPYDAGIGYWLATTPVRSRRPQVRRFRDWLAGALEPAGKRDVQRR